MTEQANQPRSYEELPPAAAAQPTAAAQQHHASPKPNTYAGLHDTRVRASAGPNRRPQSAAMARQPHEFMVQGQAVQLQPKPRPRTGQQQWQVMWDQQQPWISQFYGNYATYDGANPNIPASAAPADPNAPFMAHLLQQQNGQNLLAAYVAHMQAAAASSPTAAAAAAASTQQYHLGPGVARTASNVAEALYIDWNGCLSRQGSTAAVYSPGRFHELNKLLPTPRFAPAARAPWGSAAASSPKASRLRGHSSSGGGTPSGHAAAAPSGPLPSWLYQQYFNSYWNHQPQQQQQPQQHRQLSLGGQGSGIPVNGSSTPGAAGAAAGGVALADAHKHTAAHHHQPPPPPRTPSSAAAAAIAAGVAGISTSTATTTTRSNPAAAAVAAAATTTSAATEPGSSTATALLTTAVPVSSSTVNPPTQPPSIKIATAGLTAGAAGNDSGMGLVPSNTASINASAPIPTIPMPKLPPPIITSSSNGSSHSRMASSSGSRRGWSGNGTGRKPFNNSSSGASSPAVAAVAGFVPLQHHPADPYQAAHYQQQQHHQQATGFQSQPGGQSWPVPISQPGTVAGTSMPMLMAYPAAPGLMHAHSWAPASFAGARDGHVQQPWCNWQQPSPYPQQQVEQQQEQQQSLSPMYQQQWNVYQQHMAYMQYHAAVQQQQQLYYWKQYDSSNGANRAAVQAGTRSDSGGAAAGFGSMPYYQSAPGQYGYQLGMLDRTISAAPILSSTGGGSSSGKHQHSNTGHGRGSSNDGGIAGGICRSSSGNGSFNRGRSSSSGSPSSRPPQQQQSRLGIGAQAAAAVAAAHSGSGGAAANNTSSSGHQLSSVPDSNSAQQARTSGPSTHPAKGQADEGHAPPPAAAQQGLQGSWTAPDGGIRRTQSAASRHAPRESTLLSSSSLAAAAAAAGTAAGSEGGGGAVASSSNHGGGRSSRDWQHSPRHPGSQQPWKSCISSSTDGSSRFGHRQQYQGSFSHGHSNNRGPMHSHSGSRPHYKPRQQWLRPPPLTLLDHRHQQQHQQQQLMPASQPGFASPSGAGPSSGGFFVPSAYQAGMQLLAASGSLVNGDQAVEAAMKSLSGNAASPTAAAAAAALAPGAAQTGQLPAIQLAAKATNSSGASTLTKQQQKLPRLAKSSCAGVGVGVGGHVAAAPGDLGTGFSFRQGNSQQQQQQQLPRLNTAGFRAASSKAQPAASVRRTNTGEGARPGSSPTAGSSGVLQFNPPARQQAQQQQHQQWQPRRNRARWSGGGGAAGGGEWHPKGASILSGTSHGISKG